jgi:hypothetical protein
VIHWDDGFRRRLAIAEGAVRADRVAVAPPLRDQNPGFAQNVGTVFLSRARQERWTSDSVRSPSMSSFTDVN